MILWGLNQSLTSWPEIVSLHPKDKLEYFLIHANLEWRFRTGDIEPLPRPVPEDGKLVIDEKTSVLDGWLAVGAVSGSVECDGSVFGRGGIGPVMPR
jgi:hypothetical protein